MLHTPGPWTFGRMLLPPKVKDRRSGFVVNGQDVDPIAVRICDLRCTPESPFAVTEANARLIAAAPDLLTALECVVPDLDLLPAKVAAIVREAIARAKIDA